MTYRWPDKRAKYLVRGHKAGARTARHPCANMVEAMSYVRFLHNSGYCSVTILVRTPRRVGEAT